MWFVKQILQFWKGLKDGKFSVFSWCCPKRVTVKQNAPLPKMAVLRSIKRKKPDDTVSNASSTVVQKDVESLLFPPGSDSRVLTGQAAPPSIRVPQPLVTQYQMETQQRREIFDDDSPQERREVFIDNPFMALRRTRMTSNRNTRIYY